MPPRTSPSAWTHYDYAAAANATATLANSTTGYAMGDLMDMKVYSDIATATYNETFYGYDSMGDENVVIDPTGTITYLIYDARGLETGVWVGTADAGLTNTDPTGGRDGAPTSLSTNNMLETEGFQYDNGADGGDGNVTSTTVYVDATTTRVTQDGYDWRDRPLWEMVYDGANYTFTYNTYDNLDDVIDVTRYYDIDGAAPSDSTPPSGSNFVVIARAGAAYDNLGNEYESIAYNEPGTVAIITRMWYDGDGDQIMVLPGGSQEFTKTTYDPGAPGDDPTVVSTGYDPEMPAIGSSDAYTEAEGISADDILLTQSVCTFDLAGDQIFEVDYNRLPSDTTTTGALTATDAQVSYVADWYDPGAPGRRDVAETDYGVVAAADESAPSAPSPTNPAPTTFDSTGLTQVTQTLYNAEGENYETIDPAGRVDKTDYDDEGRETDSIENYSTTETGSDYNISTATAYGAGNLVAYTAVSTGTTTEYTAYVYGTATGDDTPDLFTNDEVRAEIEGVSEDDLSSLVSEVNTDDLSALSGVQYTEYTFDRAGETTTTTDGNLTVHTLTYNGLGAELTDSVTVPMYNPAGIDVSYVDEIAFGYKVCGRLQTVDSIGPDPDDPSTQVVKNELYFQYDTNGDLDAEYESYNGPVNTSDLSASVYIAYGYADDESTIDDPALGDVTVADAGFRPTTLQYPTTGDNASRTITDSYGDSGTMDDEINQLDAVVDGTATTSDPGDTTVTEGDTLDTVGELGDGMIVAEAYNLPGADTQVGYNLLGTTGGTPNMDQFNRVQNAVWANYGTDTNVDDFSYLYNLQGDTSMRANLVDAVFSEMYRDDAADQLTSDTRGTISGSGSDATIASPTYEEDFSVDGVGNITGDTEEQTVSGTLTTTLEQTQTPTATNEISSLTDTVGDTVAPTYDAAGNSTVTPSPLNPSEGLSIQVDGWNRPTHITSGSTVDLNYSYDGLGNMIVSINNLAPAGTASTTDMFYAGQQMIESVQQRPTSPENGETAVTDQYVFSPRYVDSPILFTASTSTYDAGSSSWSTTSADTYYYLTDANYNVTTLLNSSGGVVERYVYSAYGTPTIYNSDYSSTLSTSAAGNTTMFAGMRMDPQTGLDFTTSRPYDSVTGTFITQDPAQQGDDWYAYANSNPIDFTDPTGLYYGDAPAWTAPGGCSSSATVGTPSTGDVYSTRGSLSISGASSVGYDSNKSWLAQMAENAEAKATAEEAAAKRAENDAWTQRPDESLTDHKLRLNNYLNSKGDYVQAAHFLESAGSDRGVSPTDVTDDIYLSSQLNRFKLVTGGTFIVAAAAFELTADPLAPPLGRFEPAAGGVPGASSALRDNVLENIAQSQKARASSNFGAHLARESQVVGGYNADAWRMTTLSQGSIVYGGVPGQSAYYTGFATVQASKLNARSLFECLQVPPHPVYGYRPGIQAYRVTTELTVPGGTALNNPMFGAGGGAQFFIPNYGKVLVPIRGFPLSK